jgi:hypothetical protein
MDICTKLNGRMFIWLARVCIIFQFYVLKRAEFEAQSSAGTISWMTRVYICNICNLLNLSKYLSVNNRQIMHVVHTCGVTSLVNKGWYSHIDV